MFFNEVELLEIRLQALNEFVDEFIIIESTQAFNGHKKEPILPKLEYLKKIYGAKVQFITRHESYKNIEDLKSRLFLNKHFSKTDSENILMLIDQNNDFDKNNLSSLLDTYQREACITYIKKLTNESDWIIFSDADELPDNIGNLKKLLNHKKDFKDKNKVVFSLMQHEFWYYPNIYHNSNWQGSIVAKSSDLQSYSLNYLRKKNGDLRINTALIDGFHGYHLTNMGGIDRIKTKIKSWAHQEFNNQLVLKSLEKRIIKGEDIFYRDSGTKTKKIEINDFFSENYSNAIEKSNLFLANDILYSNSSRIKKYFFKAQIKLINFLKKISILKKFFY